MGELSAEGWRESQRKKSRKTSMWVVEDVCKGDLGFTKKSQSTLKRVVTNEESMWGVPDLKVRGGVERG